MKMSLVYAVISVLGVACVHQPQPSDPQLVKWRAIPAFPKLLACEPQHELTDQFSRYGSRVRFMSPSINTDSAQLESMRTALEQSIRVVPENLQTLFAGHPEAGYWGEIIVIDTESVADICRQTPSEESLESTDIHLQAVLQNGRATSCVIQSDGKVQVVIPAEKRVFAELVPFAISLALTKFLVPALLQTETDASTYLSTWNLQLEVGVKEFAQALTNNALQANSEDGENAPASIPIQFDPEVAFAFEMQQHFCEPHQEPTEPQTTFDRLTHQFLSLNPAANMEPNSQEDPATSESTPTDLLFAHLAKALGSVVNKPFLANHRFLGFLPQMDLGNPEQNGIAYPTTKPEINLIVDQTRHPIGWQGPRLHQPWLVHGVIDENSRLVGTVAGPLPLPGAIITNQSGQAIGSIAEQPYTNPTEAGVRTEAINAEQQTLGQIVYFALGTPILQSKNPPVPLAFQTSEIDSDGDTIPDVFDRCPVTPPILAAAQQRVWQLPPAGRPWSEPEMIYVGCYGGENGEVPSRFDRDRDGIVDAYDQCPNSNLAVRDREATASVWDRQPWTGCAAGEMAKQTDAQASPTLSH